MILSQNKSAVFCSREFLGVNTHKSYADLSERIVRLLRDERERRGLSKYAVEQRSGISQQMIGYVE